MSSFQFQNTLSRCPKNRQQLKAPVNLNTRTATAIDRAAVPRSQFNVVDQTGNAAAEARLSGQLERNGFTPPNGCAAPQSTGC